MVGIMLLSVFLSLNSSVLPLFAKVVYFHQKVVYFHYQYFIIGSVIFSSATANFFSVKTKACTGFVHESHEISYNSNSDTPIEVKTFPITLKFNCWPWVHITGEQNPVYSDGMKKFLASFQRCPPVFLQSLVFSLFPWPWGAPRSARVMEERGCYIAPQGDDNNG